MRPAGASALVTGAASGLGAATAARLRADGWHVVGVDRAGAGAGDVLRLDILDRAAVADAVAAAQRVAPLRVAVNCAGVATPAQRVLGRTGAPYDSEAWAQALDVNLTGAMHVLVETAAAMAANEPVDDDGQRGVVVTVASTAALGAGVGVAGYAASKAGVVRLSEAAAHDLAVHGIRVVCIAPGPFDTAMVPAEAGTAMTAGMVFPRRLGRPEEFAALVSHVVDNDMLNAACLRLDGGFTTRLP